MRIVLIALLFQFVCPAFLSVVPQGGTGVSEENRSQTLHASNHSIVAPLLLKEKDESESKIAELRIDLFQLIDFSDHSFVLTGYHTNKIRPFVYHDRIDHRPPLFTLHSVFLI